MEREQDKKASTEPIIEVKGQSRNIKEGFQEAES